jgi:16S rRNA A1518/A1519 N6-dimethyltransferase RsmA/KsgA/DIM1 with predicted DNA glycosylase/AP lyase activity
MRIHAIALVAATNLAVSAFAQQFGGAENLAPNIPTPQILVDSMLKVAEVNSSDMVYDLGSGDGRIVIAAARTFGARAVGIELRPDLCAAALRRVKDLGLEDRVQIMQGSFLHADLKPATVVTMYLLTSSNERLKPNLERDLKPGTRVVSNDYPIRGWKESRLVLVRTGSAEHRIYLYKIGATR